MKLFKYAATALLATAAPASAATLIIDGNGILTGATGVNVGGALFDVEFIDGTCVSLFSGCDQNTDFALNSLGSRPDVAGQALLDQVLIGVFDTNPELVRGCSNTSFCQIDIPTQTGAPGNFFGGFLQNDTGLNSDVAGIVQYSVNRDTGANRPAETFARFTPQVGAIPEPGTWAMMLLGFGVIGALMRRRRQVHGLKIA